MKENISSIVTDLFARRTLEGHLASTYKSLKGTGNAMEGHSKDTQRALWHLRTVAHSSTSGLKHLKAWK